MFVTWLHVKITYAHAQAESLLSLKLAAQRFVAVDAAPAGILNIHNKNFIEQEAECEHDIGKSFHATLTVPREEPC